MQRKDSESIHRLFKATQAQKRAPGLTPSWRKLVMADVTDLGNAPESNWERLAPRFALAGSTLSIVAMVAGAWSLSSLPGELYSVYASQLLDVTSNALGSL